MGLTEDCPTLEKKLRKLLVSKKLERNSHLGKSQTISKCFPPTLPGSETRTPSSPSPAPHKHRPSGPSDGQRVTQPRTHCRDPLCETTVQCAKYNLDLF